ncbi:MAG: glycosyltransferase family 4 protein [bacterium]
MKLLLFTLEYFPFHGGIAHYYSNMVKNYPEHITVLHNNEKQLIKPGLIKWLPAISKLWQTIKQEEINYVLVGHILPLGTATWILSYLLKFRYSVFLHGYDLSCALAHPRKAWLAKKILHKAHKIICANSYTGEKVKEIIDQKQLGKVKIVNPGIAGRPIYNEQAISKLKDAYNLHRIVLFSISRLIERKGFDKVIEAMPQIVAEVSNLVYYIAGTGPDEEYLKNKVKELPNEIQNKIKFLKSLNEADKWTWMNACDIFIMPARSIGNDIEGFGIVYLEAALAGKPVIAGKSGGVSDAVVDNLTGLMVNPEDINDIAKAVIKLSKYEGLRQRLGDQGRQRAVNEFSWKKQAQKIYNILK